MNFAERYIYDHLNVRQAGVLEFAGPCTGKECKTCMHFNEKISELTQSSDTKKPTPSNLSKAKQLRSLKKKHRSARTASNLRNCPFCDGFHPITAAEYSPGDESRRGLPRPTMEVEDGVSKRVIDENWPAKGMMHKRVPIPFGDVPGENGPESARGGLNDNPEGKDECRWCGGFITDPGETVTKWKETSELFHPGCLRSLRTFCSGARRQPEDAFKTGLYSELKDNAEKETGARTASINWDDFSKNLEEHKGREESFEGVQKGMDLDAKGFRVHDFFDKLLKGEISTKGDTRNSKPIDYTLDGHPEENIEHYINGPKNPVSEEKSWGNYEVHGVYSDHGILNSDSDFKHKVWASSSHDAIKKVKEKIYGGYTPEMNSNKKEDNLYKAYTLDLAGEKAPLFNPFTGMVETTHSYSSTNGWLHNFGSLGHLGENQIHLAVRKDPS